MEWVTIKGWDESLELEDLWTESRYQVFQKVQDHCHVAMLHFFSTTLPQVAVKCYMVSLKFEIEYLTIHLTYNSRLTLTITPNCLQMFVRNAESIFQKGFLPHGGT